MAPLQNLTNKQNKQATNKTNKQTNKQQTMFPNVAKMSGQRGKT